MKPHQIKSIKTTELLTAYLTPFAIILIITGLIFSDTDALTLKTLLSMLAFTTCFNIATLIYLKKNPDKSHTIGKLRLGVNYAFNIGFIYLMTPSWTPVWMLFLLTVIPISLLDTQKNTMIHTCIMSMVLLTVYYKHNLLQSVYLGELIVYLIFLNMTSAFVYKILELHKKYF